MTEESWMWRELTQHHYGEVTAVACEFYNELFMGTIHMIH